MNSPENTRPSSSDDIALLLSPTKARLAAEQSASWKYVTDRLAAFFAPSPVPRFERNEATLKALLDLVKANENADEERRILHEARVEALKSAESGSSSNSDGLRSQVLNQLEACLPREGRETLSSLSASSLLLSCPTGSIDEMQSRVMELTRDVFDAENDLLSLQQTQRSFELEVIRLQTTIDRFKAETDPEVLKFEEMQTQTTTMNRETKVVGMKLAEYQDRIKALSSYIIGPVSIDDIYLQEKGIQQRQDELKKLESRILAMHGLPPDLNVSRKEVERAMNELADWKGRRDKAFEGLVK